MDVRIDLVHGHGDANEERVLMTVTHDTDLKHYMLADTTFAADGTSISNVFRHTKWFSPTLAKAGDRVAVWTKKGTDRKTVHGGVTWHEFFWNSAAPIWNDRGDGAVLFQLADWVTTRAR